jgi:NADPH:quinone reductase-like Zn-dependent oxidoreductase
LNFRELAPDFFLGSSITGQFIIQLANLAGLRTIAVVNTAKHEEKLKRIQPGL